MSIPPQDARLFSLAIGEEVAATIQSLHREDAKQLIDNAWWTDLGSTLRELEDEPDSHWKWREIISVHQNKPYFRALCLKTPDDEIQAAMLVRVDALSGLAPGERAVLIDRLATAPRNRMGLLEQPHYRGGGECLLAYAVALSYSLGFSGRVNLFPIANEQFYLDRGFVRTDIIEEGEILFELPTDTAISMLEERGLI